MHLLVLQDALSICQLHVPAHRPTAQREISKSKDLVKVMLPQSAGGLKMMSPTHSLMWNELSHGPTVSRIRKVGQEGGGG